MKKEKKRKESLTWLFLKKKICRHNFCFNPDVIDYE